MAIEARPQDQQGSGTPYSAYGLGDLMGNNQVSQALMGGVSIGLNDPFSVIHANPASYISLRLPAFETGLVSRALRFELGEASANGNRTEMLGLSLGIPIGRGSFLQGASQRANRWALALGVHPVSDVGYSISESAPLEGYGDLRFEYSGDGGLTRAFLGAALTLWQNNDTIEKGSRLSIGANLNYLFGHIEETRKAYYPISSNSYNTSVSTSLIVRSPTVNSSIQFSGDLIPLVKVKERLDRRWAAVSETDSVVQRTRRAAEPLRYSIALAAELPASLAAERTELVNSFVVGSFGVEFPYDTVRFQDGAKGTAELPLMIGAGFSIYNSRWTLALDHRRRDWSQYVVRVDDQELRSELVTHAIYALGASFRPAGNGGGSLFERTTYRAGVRYAQDYRIVVGTQLQEIGMGFGMSLPLMNRTTRSRINFGVEARERGTTEGGLLRERSINFFVGITITPDVREQWFKKRRLE